MGRTSSAGRKLSRIRFVLASLGGADTKILAKAPVDATEMTGRGIAALIPALFGGLAALISFRYAYSLPLLAAAAAGAGWAVVVLCFDLSLMTAAPDRRRISRAVTFGSRAIVSVLAAFTFASAIVMFMFAKDISTFRWPRTSRPIWPYYNTTVIIPAYDAKRISGRPGPPSAPTRTRSTRPTRSRRHGSGKVANDRAPDHLRGAGRHSVRWLRERAPA